jgi:transposase InsO family protein
VAYSTNPNLPKARASAMKLLICDQLPVNVVALRSGVHRSTIWRWLKKWRQQNSGVCFVNANRQQRKVTPAGYIPRVGAVSQFRLRACSWQIPTVSSRPHSHSRAIPAHIVRAVLETRKKLQRCAEVVWHHVCYVLGYAVSLSSVRRILRRHHCFDGARKPRIRRSNSHRPRATAPGELVQTDTIHFVCPYTRQRTYIYTVIDLYTRMAYARAARRIIPQEAARTILDAQKFFGFHFKMVQADNGLEFSRHFEQTLAQYGIVTRHSRLGRPNDNAHIERFNRTLQDECTSRTLSYQTNTQAIQARLTSYLDYYNHHRVHLGIQMRTPAEMLQR